MRACAYATARDATFLSRNERIKRVSLTAFTQSIKMTHKARKFDRRYARMFFHLTRMASGLPHWLTQFVNLKIHRAPLILLALRMVDSS